MNRWIFGGACAALVIALGTASGRAADPTPKPTPKPAGEWVSLFDGKTLDGWEMARAGAKGSSGGRSRTAHDGLGPGLDALLANKAKYKNFRYRAEAKISDGGNSGQYVHCPEIKGTFSKATRSRSTAPTATRSDRLDLHDGAHLQAARASQHLVHPGGRGRREGLPRPDPAALQGVGQRRAALRVHRPLHAFPKPGYFAFQHHDPGSKVMIRKVEVKELP